MKPKNTVLCTLIGLFFINLLFTGCGVESGGNISPQEKSQNSATLSWEAPTTNADGTPLTDLAGYKIYYGQEPIKYNETIDVGNVTTYTVSNLSSDTTYYFAVTAYNRNGNESEFSEEVSKTFP